MYSIDRIYLCRVFTTTLLVTYLSTLAFGVGDVIDTNGFETGFNLGALQGQAGWVTSGQGGGTATIQNGTVEAGSKAVRVGRGANSDDRWAVPLGAYFPLHYITVDWDMNVIATENPSGVFGPFFGVDTYDAAVSPLVLGSLGVDATTGDILYQASGSGVLTETGATVTSGVWHHFQIRLDFLDDEYDVLVDGSPLAADIGFVDTSTNRITDADIATFAAASGAGSQSQTAVAYFDNFIVRDINRADYDFDGDVDGFDYLAWQRGESPDPLSAADLAAWETNFGFSSSSIAATLNTVPEPTSAVLFTVAGAVLLLRRVEKRT